MSEKVNKINVLDDIYFISATKVTSAYSAYSTNKICNYTVSAEPSESYDPAVRAGQYHTIKYGEALSAYNSSHKCSVYVMPKNAVNYDLTHGASASIQESLSVPGVYIDSGISKFNKNNWFYWDRDVWVNGDIIKVPTSAKLPFSEYRYENGVNYLNFNIFCSAEMVPGTPLLHFADKNDITSGFNNSTSKLNFIGTKGVYEFRPNKPDPTPIGLSRYSEALFEISGGDLYYTGSQSVKERTLSGSITWIDFPY